MSLVGILFSLVLVAVIVTVFAYVIFASVFV